MHGFISMTHVRHSLLDRHTVAGHPGDDSDASRMEGKVREKSLPVSLGASLEEQMPIARRHLWKNARAHRVCCFQLLNERHQGRVQLSRENLTPLRVKRDVLSLQVDVTEREAGFADAASLVKCDLKGNCHPPFRQWQMPFLRGQQLANGGNLGVGYFRLLCSPLLFDSHALKRTCGDEAAVNCLAHNSPQQAQLREGGVVAWVFLRNALNLTRAPLHVGKAERVGHSLRPKNFFLGQKRIEPFPDR